MAFADLQDDMDNAEAFVTHVVRHVIDNCRSDLDFFAGFYDKGLFSKLERLVNEPFARCVQARTDVCGQIMQVTCSVCSARQNTLLHGAGHGHGMQTSSRSMKVCVV